MIFRLFFFFAGSQRLFEMQYLDIKMIDDVSLDGIVVWGHLCFFRSERSMTGFSANGSPSSLEF